MLPLLYDRSPAPRALLRIAYGVAIAATAAVNEGRAQARPVPGAEERFVVEYYYKTRWGHDQEFIGLFRKNHLPVLEKEIEKGKDSRGIHRSAPLPRHRGGPLRLSGHNRLSECDGRARPESPYERGAPPALPRFDVPCAGGAAAVRDSRSALGPSRRCRAAAALAVVSYAAAAIGTARTYLI